MTPSTSIGGLSQAKQELQAAARASYAPDGIPAQLESCVAFVDLLGATALLRRLTDKELRRLLAALRDGVGTFDCFDAYEGPARVVTFSDNIAACLPLDSSQIDGGVGWQVIAAGQFQRNLALNGYFARGGITIGKVYADDSTVLGPGLVAAYELETEVAIEPRVVLDAAAAALFIRGALEYPDMRGSLQNDIVLYDAKDDVFFVHYLAFVWEADNDEEVDMFLTLHRDYVRASLTNEGLKRDVRSKYRWLARYHNWFCRGIRRPEFVIPKVPAPQRRFLPLVDMAFEAGIALEDMQRQRFGES